MKHIVLLGDSIFDNGVYVEGGPDVVHQLKALLPVSWRATLLAVDGNTTADLPAQIAKLPDDATHLVVSAGGNDALVQSDILHRRATSIGGAVDELAEVRAAFRQNYVRMLESLTACGKPLAVCTIFDPCFPDVVTQQLTTTVLNFFNDCILREAIFRGLPVLDVRLICSRPEDYANEIEPAVPGGKKIAAGILNLVNVHDFGSKFTTIYK